MSSSEMPAYGTPNATTEPKTNHAPCRTTSGTSADLGWTEVAMMIASNRNRDVFTMAASRPGRIGGRPHPGFGWVLILNPGARTNGCSSQFPAPTSVGVHARRFRADADVRRCHHRRRCRHVESSPHLALRLLGRDTRGGLLRYRRSGGVDGADQADADVVHLRRVAGSSVRRRGTLTAPLPGRGATRPAGGPDRRAAQAR